MKLEVLFALIEALRKEAIGEPEWVEEKGVFEYREQSIKVVAVLKLVRAAHGLSAIDVLCRSGLFIDAGAIMRCVSDCSDEVFFLLEEYPNASEHVPSGRAPRHYEFSWWEQGTFRITSVSTRYIQRRVLRRPLRLRRGRSAGSTERKGSWAGIPSTARCFRLRVSTVRSRACAIAAMAISGKPGEWPCRAPGSDRGISRRGSCRSRGMAFRRRPLPARRIRWRDTNSTRPAG